MSGPQDSHARPASPAPVGVDHLVVAARSLDEGSAWCEATEWNGVHPTDAMTASGVTLEALQLGGVAHDRARILGFPCGAAAPLQAALRRAARPGDADRRLGRGLVIGRRS